MKLKGGIIGAGDSSFIGFAHRAAATINGESEIVAGVFSKDPNKSLARGKALGIYEKRIYPDYLAMVEKEKKLPPDERLDFVIIATPNSYHYEMSIAFLNAGFHVFSDKPMATSVEQALEIKKTALNKNRIFVLTHGYTGYPMVKQARCLVESKILGRILKINVEYSQGWLSPLIGNSEVFKTWHLDPVISGPSCTMMDIGSHALNLVQTITGLIPVEVCADLGACIPGNPLDDTGSVLIHYEKGVRGFLQASQISTGEGNALRIKIYGTKAGLSWDQEYPETLEQMDMDGTSRLYKKGSKALCKDAQEATNLPGGHPEGFICAFANIYKGGFRAIRCNTAHSENCQGGIQNRDFPGTDQGIAGLSFIESILKSNISEKKWISVKNHGAE